MSMNIRVPKFEEDWRWQGWTTDEDHASGGARDNDGNFVLTGRTSQGAPNTADDETFTSAVPSDFACVKLLGDSGEVLWTWEDTALGGTDWMVSVGTTHTNDVVLGGFTTGNWDTPISDSSRGIVAVKLAGASGRELWRYQADSSSLTAGTREAGGFDASYVTSVTVDRDNNVLLVGRTFSSTSLADGDSDYFAMKLNGNTGEEVWLSQGGSPSSRESLEGAQADTGGDLIAAGFTQNSSRSGSGTRDSLVVKLSGKDGSVLWDYTTFSTANRRLLAVALDTRDNVFVAGIDDNAPAVMKLNGMTGAEMWSYRGSAESRTVFNDLAVDQGTDWVLAVGFTEGTWVSGAAAGGDDLAAVVLDGDNGRELTRYQNGTAGRDRFEFAAFDLKGRVFAGGYTTGEWSAGSATDTLDFFGVKFKSLPHSAVPPPTPSPAAVDRGLPSAAPAATLSVETASSSGVGTGTVAGLATGGILFLLLVATCVCFKLGKINLASIRSFFSRSKRVGPAARRGTGGTHSVEDFAVEPEL